MNHVRFFQFFLIFLCLIYVTIMLDVDQDYKQLCYYPQGTCYIYVSSYFEVQNEAEQNAINTWVESLKKSGITVLNEFGDAPINNPFPINTTFRVRMEPVNSNYQLEYLNDLFINTGRIAKLISYDFDTNVGNSQTYLQGYYGPVDLNEVYPSADGYFYNRASFSGNRCPELKC